MASDYGSVVNGSRGSRVVSRRGFLRAAAAIGGSAAVAGLHRPSPAAAAEHFPGYPDRFGVLTDITKCMGCRMCETACAIKNGLPQPEPGPGVFEAPRRISAQAITVVNRYGDPAAGKVVFLKEQCMHCNEPACASACLVGAIKKLPEGPVVYNEDLCMGCRYCMIACPYNMLAYEYDDAFTPAVKKCIMCADVACKEGGAPACVSICPSKATIFGKRSDLIKIARERIIQNPGQYVDHIYGENEAGGASWLYLSAIPFGQLGLPTNLGTTPYPEFTRDFLLGVPLVLMMWPPILAGLHAIIKRKEHLTKREMASETPGEEGHR